MNYTRTYKPKACKTCGLTFQPRGKEVYCESCNHCPIDGCDKPIFAYGVCGGHRFHAVERKKSAAWVERKGRSGPCEVSGCMRKVQGDGLCQMHYARRAKTGNVGEASPRKNALGQGSITPTGYRIIKYPGAEKHAYEHRHVMEQKLGRKLKRGENIHHRDGDKLHNHPDNLELWTVQQPSGQRVVDKAKWAVNFLRDHPEVLRELGVRLLLLESAEATEVLEREYQNITVSDAIRGIAGLV